MVTRIVKLTFQKDKVADFLSIFEESKAKIYAFEGVVSLALQKDINREDTYFTISKWVDENSLEQYRKSELFVSVWARTKALFGEKAEAWTLEEISNTEQWK